MKVTAAVARFTDYQTGRGLSPGTVRRHAIMAGVFAQACERVKGPDVTVKQIDHECVTRFFQDLNGSQGHRNNSLETVKAFLSWAERFGYLRSNLSAAKLLDGYKGKKAERQPKFYLDAAEFPAALEAAGQHHPVDRAVVALALFTLARASEIAAVRLADLDFGKGEVRLYREKRDRWTVTGMTPELATEMARWEQFYAREMGFFSPHAMIQEHPDWLLVPSRSTGQKLRPEQSIQFMERVAKRVLTDLGVEGTRQGRSRDHLGEGMHMFRRSGARAFLKSLSEELGHQRALVQVSLMLDHQDLQETIGYIGVDQERDQLNDWLKGHSMYGQPEPPQGGSVVPLRRVV